MIVSNVLEKKAESKQQILNDELLIKNEFCAEANCTNKYTRQVIVKKTNLDEHDEQLIVVPLCKAHYENFNGQIELVDDIEIVPTELDQD